MRQKIKRNQGFTIIEVMIVLAVAGLILVIVLLAVPALQRSARNTGRKSDASRIASAVSSFVGNSNGSLPCETGTTGGFTTTPNDAATVLADAGKLGQLSQLSANAACVTTPPRPSSTTTGLYITNANPGGNPLKWHDNFVVVYIGSVCQANWATTSGAVARNAALIYPIEQSGGTFIPGCDTAL